MNPLEQLAAVDVVTLDTYFKQKEYFSLRTVGSPFALRLDVVSASRRFKLLSEGRPRSRIVHEALVKAAVRLLQELGCSCAYIVSDEINVICLANPYRGRIEKLDSIAASIASVHASLTLGIRVLFDSRVVGLDGCSDARRYIEYRMRIGFNNYVSTLYHTVTGTDFTPKLYVMVRELEKAGIHVGISWESIGTCICWARALRVRGNASAVRRRLIRLDGSLECPECCCDEPSTYNR